MDRNPLGERQPPVLPHSLHAGSRIVYTASNQNTTVSSTSVVHAGSRIV